MVPNFFLFLGAVSADQFLFVWKGSVDKVMSENVCILRVMVAFVGQMCFQACEYTGWRLRFVVESFEEFEVDAYEFTFRRDV